VTRWRAALLAVLPGLLAGCGAPAPAPRPNLVLVTLDTTRADRLGAYGYGRPTSPHLDALAAEAILFENAYSTSSWTLPAHASLFTGLYPASHGVRHDPAGPLLLASAIDAPDGIRARPLAPGQGTLAEWLRGAGYRTAGFVAGPWLLRVFGLGRGFEVWDDAGITDAAGRRAREVTEAALAWLEREAREPFLLFLNYFDPHAPYLPPPEWAGSFLPRGLRPDPRSAAQAPALYDAEILYMDHELGRVLRRLRERGIFERTLVVVTSDHGELLGERGEWGHERFLWEPLVRVPLLVKPAGPARPGRRETARASLVDVPSLVLAAAGVAAPPGLQGAWPVPSRRALLAEVNPLSAESDTGDWRGLLEGPFKYLESSLGDRLLFDLARDPEERHDLSAGDPEALRRAAERLAAAFAALPPAPPPAAPVALDPEAAEALRRLGYLEEGAAPAPR
jgi:arylsulfatase A-like enzyme